VCYATIVEIVDMFFNVLAEYNGREQMLLCQGKWLLLRAFARSPRTQHDQYSLSVNLTFCTLVSSFHMCAADMRLLRKEIGTKHTKFSSLGWGDNSCWHCSND
jgi:Fe2+ transport system protein B